MVHLGESAKETQRNGLIHLLAARSHHHSNKLLMLPVNNNNIMLQVMSILQK